MNKKKIIVTEDLAHVGMRVVRGPDWSWGNQDGGVGGIGVIRRTGPTKSWVSVDWDNGGTYGYRVGGDNKYDLFMYDPFTSAGVNTNMGTGLSPTTEKIQNVRERMSSINKSETKSNNNDYGRNTSTSTDGIKVRRPVSTIKGPKRR